MKTRYGAHTLSLSLSHTLSRSLTLSLSHTPHEGRVDGFDRLRVGWLNEEEEDGDEVSEVAISVYGQGFTVWGSRFMVEC